MQMWAAASPSPGADVAEGEPKGRTTRTSLSPPRTPALKLAPSLFATQTPPVDPAAAPPTSQSCRRRATRGPQPDSARMRIAARDGRSAYRECFLRHGDGEVAVAVGDWCASVAEEFYGDRPACRAYRVLRVRVRRRLRAAGLRIQRKR